MHTLEPVNRTTPPCRKPLPATARATGGSTHGTDSVATMEVQ
jgi:hypothetical protein